MGFLSLLNYIFLNFLQWAYVTLTFEEKNTCKLEKSYHTIFNLPITTNFFIHIHTYNPNPCTAISKFLYHSKYLMIPIFWTEFMNGGSRVLELLTSRSLGRRDQAIKKELSSSWKKYRLFLWLGLLEFTLRFSESFPVLFQVGCFDKNFWYSVKEQVRIDRHNSRCQL